jgi:hypothetical protein
MADRDERAIANEERIIYIAMILIALPKVVGSLVSGGSIGAGASLCMAIAALGLVGLASRMRLRRRRIPRAVARIR